jgi:hypothetical protein
MCTSLSLIRPHRCVSFHCVRVTAWGLQYTLLQRQSVILVGTRVVFFLFSFPSANFNIILSSLVSRSFYIVFYVRTAHTLNTGTNWDEDLESAHQIKGNFIR